MTSVETPSTEQVKEDVQHLKEWLLRSPHLPNIQDEDWLETFLRNCKFRLEKTKAKLDCYYSLKNKHPALLKCRDPTAPELLMTRQAVSVGLAESLTKEGYLLIFCKYGDDPSHLNMTDYFKRYIMVHDVILLEKLAPNGVSFVVDFTNFRYQLFLKTMFHIRSLIQILTSCYAEKFKAAHLISSSQLVLHMISFIKKIAPRKVVERVKIVGATMSNIHEHIDSQALCSDFGGQGAPLAQLEEKTQQLLEKHREWFLEQDNLCAALSKKSKNKEDSKNSLKNLEID